MSLFVSYSPAVVAGRDGETPNQHLERTGYRRPLKSLTKNLNVFAHHTLLRIQKVFILTRKFWESVSRHERIKLVQAFCGFTSFCE